MDKFLIEVPHESDVIACARVVKVFLASGSHFLTNADWGCADGKHSAWFTLEAEDREVAKSVLPPVFRADAKVVKLNKFSMEEIDEHIRQHGGER